MAHRRRLRNTTQIIKERLPVPLSEGEVLAHADLASRLQSELEEKRDSLKSHSKAAKAEMETIETERNSALSKVRERREYRDVEVEVEMRFSENAVRFKRRDTGEIIRERAMTTEERQTQLFDMSELDDTPQEERSG